MLGNIVAVSFAVVLLISTLLSLWRRLNSLTLPDAFLLAIALFLGAYTLVDVFTVEPVYTDPLIVTGVFLTVSYASLILWWFARRPGALIRETSLARLRQDWIACPTWPILAMVVISLLYWWYTATSLGAVIDPSNPASIEETLPYWYTSLGILSNDVAYPAGLCAWAKARAARGLHKWLWFVVLAFSFVAIFGMGRRAAFAFLLIVGWELVTQTRARRRRWVSFMLLVLSAPLVIMMSNLFQAYRVASYRGVPIASMAFEDDNTLVEKAVDVNKTVSNLQERPSVWRFNYEIMKADWDETGDLQWGRLFVSGIQNFIPAAFFPGKTIFEEEDETNKAFQLERIDKPGNIFAFTYADFGFLSILGAPLLILAFVFVCGFALQRFRDPFIRMTLMGLALFYALNLEAAYLTPLAVTREFALITIVYVLIREGRRFLRRLLLYATHS